jgi:hypothetical protein
MSEVIVISSVMSAGGTWDSASMGELSATDNHVGDNCTVGSPVGSLPSADTGILLRDVGFALRPPSIVYNRIGEHVLIVNKSQPTGIALIDLGFTVGLVVAVLCSIGMTEHCATADCSTCIVIS